MVFISLICNNGSRDIDIFKLYSQLVLSPRNPFNATVPFEECTCQTPIHYRIENGIYPGSF